MFTLTKWRNKGPSIQRKDLFEFMKALHVFYEKRCHEDSFVDSFWGGEYNIGITNLMDDHSPADLIEAVHWLQVVTGENIMHHTWRGAPPGDKIDNLFTFQEHEIAKWIFTTLLRDVFHKNVTDDDVLKCFSDPSVIDGEELNEE